MIFTNRPLKKEKTAGSISDAPAEVSQGFLYNIEQELSNCKAGKHNFSLFQRFFFSGTGSVGCTLK